MDMTKMRALVTGGAGFLGSHLCERLLRDGHEVTALDDLSTGLRSNLTALSSGSGPSKFRFVHHDVTLPFEGKVAGPFDRVFNLACPASPPHYQEDPVKTTLTCVVGTLHALQIAQRDGARFFQASTSEVYGDPEVHPQPEEYRGNVNPHGIRSCYDEGKRCGESLVMDFRRQYGVDVRIARIFNTYGPRMRPDDGRVVSNFIVQAIAGDALTIYGDGSQTRSFCYVDDLIEGILKLTEAPSVTGPVNLGNPDEFTVLELAQRVIQLTGSASSVVRRPLPKDDPKVRRPVIERAWRELGFAPRVKLEEGLRRTIASFRRTALSAPPPAVIAAAS